MSIIMKEVKIYWKQMLILIAAVAGNTLAALGLPSVMKNLIDYSIPNKDTGSVWVYSGIMLMLVVAELFCGMISARMSSLVSMETGRNLRQKMFSKVQGLSQEEIDKLTTSSLITRTSSDIAAIQTFLQQCLNIALMAPVMCIFGMILAIRTSARLSSVLLVSVPVMALAVVLIGKAAIPLSVIMQNRLDTINMVIREKLTGTRVIRAFGTTQHEEERFEKINAEYTGINRKMNNILALLLPAVVLILASTVAVILLLAYKESLLTPGVYTTGEVMTLVQYVMVILAAVTMLTIVLLLLPRAAASAARVKEVLESENKIKDPAEPKSNPSQTGCLEYRDVSFTYAGASVPALKHLSFKAGPGEVTAIIGGTGMGKTTIINLIPRLYDVSEGQVLLDGVDVREYSLADLRSRIGFVPQKANLFKGTIDSNIAFGDQDPDPERIEQAVRTAQSWDFVTAKEQGFDAPVAQGGANFSGGQKQRLCIARAIVRRPEVYVFDDSFSALDFKTDRLLREALKPETKNATTVIVAQRISTIMDADRIIVIDRGEIKGIGTHKELLKSCPVYLEIAQSQLSREELEK